MVALDGDIRVLRQRRFTPYWNLLTAGSPQRLITCDDESFWFRAVKLLLVLRCFQLRDVPL